MDDAASAVDRRLRFEVIALGSFLVVQTGFAFVFGLVSLVFLEVSTPVVLGCILGGAFGLFTSIVLLFELSDLEPSRFRGAVLAIQVLFEAIIVAVALRQVVNDLAGADTFAMRARLDAFWLALAFSAMLAAGGCARAVARQDARKPELWRRLYVAGVAASSVLLLGAATSAAVTQTSLPCRPFEFDSARWNSGDHLLGGTDRIRIGRALARCDTLIGKTKPEVQEMLGNKNQARFFPLGYADGFIFENRMTLVIDYDESGRADHAKVESTPSD